MRAKLMTPKKAIMLGVETNGRNIICPSLTTLSLVLGTKGAAGNLSIYGTKKVKDKYVVPIKAIKERIRTLEKNKARIEDYLKIMKSAIE